MGPVYQSFERVRDALTGHRVAGVHLEVAALVLEVRRDAGSCAGLVVLDWPWAITEAAGCEGQVRASCPREGISAVYAERFWQQEWARCKADLAEARHRVDEAGRLAAEAAAVDPLDDAGNAAIVDRLLALYGKARP